MASTKEYLDFVLEQLDGLEGLRSRGMMGEYLLYCEGKVVGGVYDDRMLLKPTPSALALVKDSGLELTMELPYEGGQGHAPCGCGPEGTAAGAGARRGRGSPRPEKAVMTSQSGVEGCYFPFNSASLCSG